MEVKDVTDKNALEILECVYSNYETFFKQQNNVKQQVDEHIKENFKEVKIVGPVPYYTLWNIWKTKEEILKIDEDAIICILGKPGKGKTSVSFIISFFLDKDFDQTRVIFTFEELLQFLKECADELEKENTLPGYVSKLRGLNIVVDEGVYIFFSADVNTKEGKFLTKLLTVIRFLNLVVFVNATNYEKLNKLLRESRLRNVIRIDEKGIISYFSPKRTSQIEVDSDNNVIFPEPNFTENVGYISKDTIFWKGYNGRKSNFTSNTINEIIRGVSK